MDKNITIIKSPSIEKVKGFYSNAVHCGLKKNRELDLGIVFSEKPSTTFAMYTTNSFQAAPVKVAQKHLDDNTSQLLIVNSKIANACTGKLGIKNAEEVCGKAAELFNIRQEDVIPMSTGVIGEHLPVEKINNGLIKLKEIVIHKNPNSFSEAIMTTDKYPKIHGVKVKAGEKSYSIVGTAKGAGMICPNMATMLAFIFTDALISKTLLKKAFNNSINLSLNSITVDGDTSTNDTSIIFNNGLAKNAEIAVEDSAEYRTFCEALSFVCVNLAKDIVSDGEGATKCIEINVINAKTETDAKKTAMSIGNSNLVKTALFGEDANWGRIVCAAGYSGVNFNPDKVTLSVGDVLVFAKGLKTNFLEKDLNKFLQKKEIKITLNLGTGEKSHTVWASDLTYDYIKINAGYRS
jgi:glutamate N-acetyltransferase / amino-acid N-acetyltransferase